eukprot:Rhum_TRINITY_DN14705_c11_g2::Rhum_TRINITY_DN14705_c11_g2_i1::g.112260::m.112260
MAEQLGTALNEQGDLQRRVALLEQELAAEREARVRAEKLAQLGGTGGGVGGGVGSTREEQVTDDPDALARMVDAKRTAIKMTRGLLDKREQELLQLEKRKLLSEPLQSPVFFETATAHTEDLIRRTTRGVDARSRGASVMGGAVGGGAGGAGGGSGAPELLANALSALTGQAGSGGGATGAPGPSGPAPAGPDNRGDSRYYGGGANLAALAQLNSLGGLGGPGAVGPIGGGGGLKRPASAMDGGAGSGGERFGGDRRGDGEPEWECQCGNTNWATRPVCRKCGSPRDGEAGPAGPTTMRTAYSSFRGNNNERVRKGSCWNCGSMEHLKVECPYLDGKAAPTICPCKYQKGSCAYENTGCRFLGLPVSTCHGYLVGKCSDKECSLTHLEAPACPHVFQKGTCMFGKDCMLADRPVDECCFPTCMRGETCRRRHQFHKVTDENGVKCYVHPTKPQHMGKGKGRRWEEGGGGGYGKGRKGGYDRGYDRGYDDYDEQGGAGGGGGGG